MKRIQDTANHTPESVEQLYRCFVAEEQGEIVGVALLRKVQEFMKPYTITAHAAEFYISGVKYKGRGIGHALREARIQEAKKIGFNEIILYSSQSHKDAWSFHDKSDFKRVGEVLAPNGEPGVVWRMIL
jgi:L-amino acid N-acyltransferase YncA